MNALSHIGPVFVVGTIWLDGDDSDPPTLELRLSSGAYVKVGFDTDYHHVLRWFAPDAHADYQSATAEQCGLGDLLGAYEAQAEAAVRAHESNQRADWLADANNWSDDR